MRVTARLERQASPRIGQETIRGMALETEMVDFIDRTASRSPVKIAIGRSGYGRCSARPCRRSSRRRRRSEIVQAMPGVQSHEPRASGLTSAPASTNARLNSQRDLGRGSVAFGITAGVQLDGGHAPAPGRGRDLVGSGVDEEADLQARTSRQRASRRRPLATRWPITSRPPSVVRFGATLRART